MFIDNSPPSLAYDNNETIFNYCVQNVLVDILRKNKENLIDINGVKVLVFNEETYIVYVNHSLEKLDFEKGSNSLKIKNYNRVVAKALQSGGVYSMLSGLNALEKAQSLSEVSGLSVDYIMNEYNSRISLIEDQNEVLNFLANSIPKLYDLAIKTKQVKTDESDNDNIKKYCDCDFSIYTYNNKFMISCVASANLYHVDFTDKGFKVYGHSNDYGKVLEEKNNPEFDWDNAEFEPYYLKYLNENMLIMTVEAGNACLKNSLVEMLNSIVEYIIEEENL